MFTIMEIAEQVYKGGTPSKTIKRADANRSSHSRNKKGREASSPPNPEKDRNGKCKKIDVGNWNDQPMGGRKFFLYGPIHSSEVCKALMDYSEKYATQRPHKEDRSRSK